MAQALLPQTIHETKADIAIVSEPNKIPATDGWYGSTNQTCAIYFSPDVNIIRHGQSHGYVWIETPELRVYSCYFSPKKRHTIDDYKAFLFQLSESVRLGPKDVIVAGDFNAHSPWWGSPYTFAKGNALTDTTSALGLIVCNIGDAPTFERGGSSSHIDVTFASQRVLRKMDVWKILDVESGSDHKYILYTPEGRVVEPGRAVKGWPWRHMDTPKLVTFLNSYIHPEEEVIFDEPGLTNLQRQLYAQEVVRWQT